MSDTSFGPILVTTTSQNIYAAFWKVYIAQINS